MYRLEFQLTCLPKTTNANVRLHWRKKHRESRALKSRVASMAIIAGRPASPLKKAKLTLERHSSCEPDFDGLVSSFKFIIDGLVDCGVLFGDKTSVIGRPEYIWVRASPKKGKIVVIVEELK
jgi:hypothetical protein